MKLAGIVLAFVLAQEPEPPPAAPEAEPSAEAVKAEPAKAQAPSPASPARPKGADEVSRVVQKLPSMTAKAQADALAALQRQFGQADTSPVLPSADVDLEAYLSLQPAEQAEVAARGFFVDLIAGDPGRLVARSGYPFFMEARRIDRPEELRALWGKSLRSRRTDLLKLYSVEILLPAEMEKKHGKPPPRLNGWNWRSTGTYLALGNLSGHGVVLLLRQAGAAWQVVGFHD